MLPLMTHRGRRERNDCFTRAMSTHSHNAQKLIKKTQKNEPALECGKHLVYRGSYHNK